ncbi:MAG: 50S ribosomal protein L5 [candidate division WS1 bacterium]|jgi:large subunit ribosomal protein L5|nr:50S ribosomal protein L5 [candidate division WS1 bacterium]
MAYKPRLKEKYETEIRPQMMEQFGYKNVNEAPRPVKVSVTMGVREGGSNFETLERAVKEVAQIIGQRPAITRAKRSVANFAIRKDMPIGLRATLRHDRMWEFLDRLFSVAVPRIRDFRGLERKSMDGRGNYSLGITDLLIFPELGYDDVEKTRGLNICITTTAKDDESGRDLLVRLGLPLKPAEG